ncbi:cation diffusion facilitator family transporter [Flavobacterium sp. ASW18X]|uniref:cation diffusion facilitator family transporter n=1 Tax=Flavobacterium sp. ASW18X TaxID=2572595 RepID=UPI0010AE976D|nr:cation diffusion facilitator family transporter [Flavobacterium sp. ASW18X]TKD65131.1 cation transporter [Flavobacterium sp. ASW18X]
MGQPHNHTHSYHTSDTKLTISIFLNVGITVAQIIGGLLSGSLSLLSDALHNFSDVISLIISLIANRLARKKSTTNKTFGYKRAEIIAAFINAATLLIVAVLLIKEAVVRFLEPQQVASGLVIGLSAIAIVFNGLSVLLLKKDSNNNMNLKSAYLHLLTDMLASVAVLFGGLLMQYYHWFWVDPLLTLLIALYLIYVGFDLLKESTNVLMLFTPESIVVDDIVACITTIEAIKNVHHVHIWQLNDDEVHLEAHLDFNTDIRLSEFDVILNQIEAQLFYEFGINHVNIQPEFGKCDSKNLIVQD